MSVAGHIKEHAILGVTTPSTSTGNVTGPVSVIDEEVVVFDGTTGKKIKSVPGLTITVAGDICTFKIAKDILFDYTGATDEIFKVIKDFEVGQHIFVGNKISHKGDSNTYIAFENDRIDFYAGSWKFLSLIEAAQDKVEFNPNKYNIDLVANGDHKDGVLYLDAGTDRLSFGGGIASPSRLCGSNQTVTYSDHLIYCSNTMTLSLPSSGVNGQELIIVNRGVGTITINPNGAETINGAASQTITAQYKSITIRADKGVGWYITTDTR